MKAQLLLMLGLLLYVATGQAAPTPTDSLKAKLALIVKRQDSLMTGLKQLLKHNDSLNKELERYHAKDDFYVMAVDRQGSHFEWLLGSTLAIVAFFTYAYFIDEFKRVRREFDSIIRGYLAKLNDTSYRTHRQFSFNISSSIQTLDILSSLVETLGATSTSTMSSSAGLFALRLTALVEDVKAYILIHNEDEKQTEDCLIDIKRQSKALNGYISIFLDTQGLVIDTELIRSSFDWHEKEAFDYLHAHTSQIKDTDVKAEVMQFLLKAYPIANLL